MALAGARLNGIAGTQALFMHSMCRSGNRYARIRYDTARRAKRGVCNKYGESAAKPRQSIAVAMDCLRCLN
jgi:hypothetical protein